MALAVSELPFGFSGRIFAVVVLAAECLEVFDVLFAGDVYVMCTQSDLKIYTLWQSARQGVLLLTKRHPVAF